MEVGFMLRTINVKGYVRALLSVFGNGLNWRKWTGTVADLIDVKKK